MCREEKWKQVMCGLMGSKVDKVFPQPLKRVPYSLIACWGSTREGDENGQRWSGAM